MFFIILRKFFHILGFLRAFNHKRMLETEGFGGLMVLTGYGNKKQKALPNNEFSVAGFVKFGNLNTGVVQLNCWSNMK